MIERQTHRARAQ